MKSVNKSFWRVALGLPEFTFVSSKSPSIQALWIPRMRIECCFIVIHSMSIMIYGLIEPVDSLPCNYIAGYER